MSFDQIKVELCDWWGEDRNVANQAWASSFEKEIAEAKTDNDVRRVISTVTKHHHDTPKERVWFDFFITCSIFVERQFDKYRITLQQQDFIIEYFEGKLGRLGITQNELSGRYRTLPERPYLLPDDVAQILARSSSHAVEEMGGTPNTYGTMVQQEKDLWEERLLEQYTYYQNYLNMARSAEKVGRITNEEYKRTREVVRGLLGTAYLTDMRMVMNLNAFEHIMNQRLAKGTQMESRVTAYKLYMCVKDANCCPVVLVGMTETNGWQSLLDEISIAIKSDSLLKYQE